MRAGGSRPNGGPSLPGGGRGRDKGCATPVLERGGLLYFALLLFRIHFATGPTSSTSPTSIYWPPPFCLQWTAIVFFPFFSALVASADKSNHSCERLNQLPRQARTPLMYISKSSS